MKIGTDFSGIGAPEMALKMRTFLVLKIYQILSYINKLETQ